MEKKKLASLATFGCMIQHLFGGVLVKVIHKGSVFCEVRWNCGRSNSQNLNFFGVVSSPLPNLLTDLER
jgi:hypothetical protein